MHSAYLPKTYLWLDQCQLPFLWQCLRFQLIKRLGRQDRQSHPLTAFRPKQAKQGYQFLPSVEFPFQLLSDLVFSFPRIVLKQTACTIFSGLSSLRTSSYCCGRFLSSINLILLTEIVCMKSSSFMWGYFHPVGQIVCNRNIHINTLE